MPLTVRPIETDADWALAEAIRRAVFVGEQGYAEADEWDGWDWPADRGRRCRHLLAEADGRPVGTARWYAAGGGAKLGRFALVPEARGRGWGRALVRAALADARAAGHTRFVLHAQLHLRRFYEALGFAADGEPFAEDGAAHLRMTRDEAPAPSGGG